MKKIFKLNESKLRMIIRESLNEILSEHDPDEYEYDDYNPYAGYSKIIIAINPETLEILNVGGYDEWKSFEKDGYRYWIEFHSEDFPDAYGWYKSGDYFNPPEGDSDPGSCGGEFESEENTLNDWFEEQGFDENVDQMAEDLVDKFISLHTEDIIDSLNDYAEVEYRG